MGCEGRAVRASVAVKVRRLIGSSGRRDCLIGAALIDASEKSC